MVSKKTVKQAGIDYTNYLLNDGATYASVILTSSTELKLYHSSNEKWDEMYHHTGYSKECHLIRAVNQLLSKSQNITLVWDCIQPANDISIYLNERRTEMSLCHGVSFCQRNPNGITQIITLTGRNSDINFAKAAISNKNNILTEFANIQKFIKHEPVE